MIREWCSCGAAFHARSIALVREWRKEHKHEPNDEPRVPPTGAESRVELSPDVFYDAAEVRSPSPRFRHIGFQP